MIVRATENTQMLTREANEIKKNLNSYKWEPCILHIEILSFKLLLKNINETYNKRDVSNNICNEVVVTVVVPF